MERVYARFDEQIVKWDENAEENQITYVYELFRFPCEKVTEQISIRDETVTLPQLRSHSVLRALAHTLQK